AQEKGIFLVFTIWDHPQLRGSEHAWGAGNWQANNGFRHLTSVEAFFTDAEAWAWQENFYRYIIARWGYSPAIGLWQTVSEINGTNAYANTNRWHEKVNNYFVENDPYRHPTTASMSGDVDWPEGHAVMDVPQVHLYEFENDAVASAGVLADWTALMWRTGKPNWVGEFGVPGNTYYPELFHNALWAALANGAALTPAEWNSGGSWMQMTPEMYAVAGRLAAFMQHLPLAAWDAMALTVTSLDEEVRGWGVAGEQGGRIWVQDYYLPGEDMAALRADESLRSGVTLQVENLPGGDYLVTPYDTWQGQYMESFELACPAGQACLLNLPDFQADLALKITALP
ncbi:MAG: hypothetical protein JW862_11775, partial [Anaerolineales bacterium]|nr:hypothetical protein [Anaerolineales bacterium]